MNTNTETVPFSQRNQVSSRPGDWMQTHSGGRFYPLDPQPADICIEDIAHALSNLCRFGGHCREFYSVAQHSVLVSQILPPGLQLAGLLHDATEAYLVDIPRPLKVALPQYKEIEHKLEAVVAVVFGVRFSDARIKHADNVALVTEARDLLGAVPADWALTETPLAGNLTAWSPQVARKAFLSQFAILTDPHA